MAQENDKGVSGTRIALTALTIALLVTLILTSFDRERTVPVIQLFIAPMLGVMPAVDASNADDRFGVILSDSAYFQQTLRLMELAWYQDYSFNARGIPSGVAKVLKVRTNRLSAAQDIKATARARPGNYWLIGNEPNTPGQDDVSPEIYAVMFRYYVTAIKEADPDAKIIAPEILNFDRTCTGCPGYTSGREWLGGFRRFYRELYGAEPPVDVWSIHTYDLDWEQLPLGDYQVQAMELLAFREYLDAIPEQQDKPIWLTEFSVMWGYGGIQWEMSGEEPVASPIGELRKEHLKAYLKDMINWLRANATVLRLERWFLFSSHPYQEPWATAPGGIALVEGTGVEARLTELGSLYKDLAKGASAGQ